MILRTYGCEQCNHMLTVELRADQWNAEPPYCPNCIVVLGNTDARMHQEFAPPAIGGSARARATAMALDIAEKDYGVADIQADGRPGGVPKVRYRDQSGGTSSWGAANAALSQAVALGRETRLKHGSSLDIIKGMPDLIAESKKRSARVW